MFGLSVTRLSLAGLGHAPSIRLSNLSTGLKGSAAQHSWTCYRLVEQCDKAKLDFRYKTFSRGSAALPVQWVPAQARQIQESVERVA